MSLMKLICCDTYFHTLYIQANDGNVEIVSQEMMDSIALKLLSTQRNFDNIMSTSYRTDPN